MDLQAFLRPAALPVMEKEEAVSERFVEDGVPVRWRLRGISEEENALLRRSCQKRGSGFEEPAFDRERYLKRLAAACVVYPDLKNGRLRQSWGVMGEEALLGRMLTAGEFDRLLRLAQEVCGFLTAADAEKVKGELKNGCGSETAS